MREWKRILLSPVWLGVLALLVVCHGGLFLQKPVCAGGGRSGPLQPGDQPLGGGASEPLSLPEGQARLAEARQALWLGHGPDGDHLRGGST